MSLATPITNGHMVAGAQVYAGSTSPAAGPSEVGSGGAASVQGTGSLSGLHNTPLHVAGILLVAGGVIVGLHYLGFRFGFDVGLGRG